MKEKTSYFLLTTALCFALDDYRRHRHDFVHDRENNFMVFKHVYWHVVAFSSSPATRGNSSGASPSWAVVLFAAPWKRSKWDVALINATLRRFCWETTRFCPIDHLCRFVPTLSQQLREDFA